MNIKQIRYFIEIAECKSFSKASERIRIAQPALSSQLKSLEEELGVKLLVRHSRGVSLTEMGDLVKSHFKKIIFDIDNTKSLITEYTTNPSGDVNIGITTTAARALVTLLVERSKKQFPNITLHLFEAMSGTLYEQLNKGSLDMAILYNFGRYERSADLIDTPIAHENLYLVKSSRSTPEIKGNSIGFSKIQDLPLALPSHPHTLNSLLREISIKRGITINMAAEVNSFTGMVELTKAGYYTVSPLVSIRKEIERGELFAIPIVDPEIYWTIHLVARREGYISHPISAVHKLIVSIISELIENKEWEAEMV